MRNDCAPFPIAHLIAHLANFLILLYIFLLSDQYINKYGKLDTVGNEKNRVKNRVMDISKSECERYKEYCALWIIAHLAQLNNLAPERPTVLQSDKGRT